MRRPWKHLFALTVLWLGVALAQTPELPDLDSVSLAWLLGLARDPVALGVLVFGIVSSVKRNAEARKPPITWNPWIWRGLALGSGVVLTLLLYGATRAYGLSGYATLGAPGLPGALLFGLVVGAISITGRDGLKTILSWVTVRPAATGTLPAPAPVVSGEVTPPEGFKAPPSGIEPLPGGTVPVAAQGLLGGGVLLEMGLGALIEMLLRQAQLPASAEQIARVAARLAVVAPDLLDGDPRMSWQHRDAVLGVIMDLKARGGLT